MKRGKPYVTLAEAASVLRVSYSAAWRLVQSGELSSERLYPGGTIWVALDGIIAYAERRGDIYADEVVDAIKEVHDGV